MEWRRSACMWVGRIAAAGVLAGLVAYLASVGLDKADKLASVLGLLVAVTALVAPHLLSSSDGDRSGPGSAQHIVNTVVGGNLTQVQDAKGLRVQRQIAFGPPPLPLPKAGPAPESQGGQYVNGVWVGGNLTQVDGADGDVTIG